MVEVKDFWPEVADDLTKVRWSHATNSVARLASALEDGTMMIEADVSLGAGDTVIMAHPPDISSDLDLETFINTVLQARARGKKIGFKLDFKFIAVVEPSLKILRSSCQHIDFPVWLNADILKLDETSAEPVDPEQFLKLCKAYFPSSTLSIGYTTTCTGKYTETNFMQMLELIQNHEIVQPVTLPLRACLLARSKTEVLQYLEKAGENHSITVWSGVADQVDVDALRDVLVAVGKNRLYLDVPKDLEERLQSAGSSLPSAFFVSSMLALFLLLL